MFLWILVNFGCNPKYNRCNRNDSVSWMRIIDLDDNSGNNHIDREECIFGCFKLTSITLSNSVVFIGQRAFIRCSSLDSISIPNSVSSIGSEAIYECRSLVSMEILGSVALIEEKAFYNCSSLV